VKTTRFVLFILATLAAPLAAWSADGPGQDSFQHGQHSTGNSQGLVDIVREAMEPFKSPASLGPDFAPFLGCFSGPDGGAMGVHFVNGNRVMNPELDPKMPEAVIYEPTPRGFRLVGVEFIVDAKTWHAQPGDEHKNPPVLEGQSLQFVDSPNRFKLDPFYELHVWLRENPNGAFADWNTHVSCEGAR
jgi:hypothetical protein